MEDYQFEKVKNYCFEKDLSFATYKDYFNAIEALDLNLDEDKNLIPHDFEYWHNIRTDEYATKKAMIDAEKRKELYQQFEKVAEKYEKLQYAKNAH